MAEPSTCKFFEDMSFQFSVSSIRHGETEKAFTENVRKHRKISIVEIIPFKVPDLSVLFLIL
jgi:hypothetical protein